MTAANSTKIQHAQVEHTPEALNEWAAGLRQRLGGHPIAVCLEQSRGALVYALMRVDFLVLFPMPPKKLARYREAILSTSGAKDDPTDAELLLDYLANHRDRLRAWQPDDRLTREITLLGEARRGLVDLRTKLSNTLKSQLKCYFPQTIGWLNDTVYTTLACDFLLKWPTLEALQKAKPQTVRSFFYGHHSRGDRIEKILDQIPDAKPLISDSAVINVSVAMVKALAKQLRSLADSIEAFEKKQEELFARHDDAAIFTALPGAGKVLAPRLLGAFGSNREKFELSRDVATLSGIAPVTRHSGKKRTVHRRWACPKFLRQSFHEFADQSRMKSVWARAYYQKQRGNGAGHNAAIRALAFKWIRVIFRCWKDRCPYDESTYLQSLRNRNSPLLKFLPQTNADLRS